MIYIPPGIAPDLAHRNTESRVERKPPGPNAEAWLRERMPAYAKARDDVIKAGRDFGGAQATNGRRLG